MTRHRPDTWLGAVPPPQQRPQRAPAAAREPDRGVSLVYGRYFRRESTIATQSYDVTPGDMKQVALRSAEVKERRQAETDQFFARLAMLVGR